MRPFLAYIMPVGEGGGGGPVDPGYSPPWAQLPGTPPGPVDPGYSPPWARPQPPRPDNTLPGGQGGHPSHPIYWPPGTQPHPDQGLPGPQPRPDHGLPPFPSHPIYFPPEGGQPPLGIWGPTDPRPSNPISGIPGLPGSPGQQPHPEHPIVLPPDLPPVIPPEGGQPERKIVWKTAWTPTTGWIVVGIPAEGTLVPTPSS